MPKSLITGERLDIPREFRFNHEQGKLQHPMKYPSPFFDLSKFYFPKTVKDMFKWCRYYYKNEGLITSTIYKLSEYPVTDLIFSKPNDIEDTGYDKLKTLVKDKFKIKDFLIQIGLDYFTYGNALVSIYFPFKRYLKCPECNHRNQKEDFGEFGKRGKLDFREFEFKGKCPNCKSVGVTFTIDDDPIKKVEKINLIRHNPQNFDIKYNSITGESTYLYNVPKELKKKISNKDEDILMTTPKDFIKALKDKKAVKLKNSKIFHFKRADIADDEMGWGMPLILPIMKNMFHLQVLRKAQQQIAMEHLVPLRVLYPADNQSTAAPHQVTGLGKWKSRVEVEIKKWKRDPNYIPIMPVPLGYQKVSGDGKMLLLTQEMKMIAEEIINGMGVPQEFVFGGLSWSGSSISLRMLENHFLVYRNELIEFLNQFLVKQLSNFLGVKEIDINMQQFKMADDIQRKQLLQQLNDVNKVSDTTFLKEVAGLDNANETKQMVEDLKNKKELFEMIGMEQGTIQGKAQELIAKAQAKAQSSAAQTHQRGEGDKKPADFKGYWQELLQVIEQEKAIEQEEAAENMMAAPQDPEIIAAQYAEEIMEMGEEEQRQVLSQMREEQPELFELVIKKLQQIQEAADQKVETGGGGSGGSVDMRPNPAKKPPRRENASV